jgi:hypothetical protein
VADIELVALALVFFFSSVLMVEGLDRLMGR